MDVNEDTNGILKMVREQQRFNSRIADDLARIDRFFNISILVVVILILGVDYKFFYLVPFWLISKMVVIYWKKSQFSFRDIYWAFKTDVSLWSLLVVNILIVYDVWINKLGLMDLLWVYWWQTLIVMIFLMFKIADHGNFNELTGERYKFWGMKIYLLIGILSGVILLFVVALIWFPVFGNNTVFDSSSFNKILIGVVFLNHLFSFWYNRKKDKENVMVVSFRSLGFRAGSFFLVLYGQMFFVFLGGKRWEWLSIMIFIFIKILIDLTAHISEHRRDGLGGEVILK